jgi:hypothetical protein
LILFYQPKHQKTSWWVACLSLAKPLAKWWEYGTWSSLISMWIFFAMIRTKQETHAIIYTSTVGVLPPRPL